MTAAVAEVQARMAAIQARFAIPAGVLVRPLTSSPRALPGGAHRADFQEALAMADAPSASRVTGDQVIAAARKYLGVPYVWGGTDPSVGLDCSGFIQRSYKDLGIDVPRVSADQARAGRPVASLADARPGDLVAFDWSAARPGIDHIGIYMGDNKMIVAPRSGDVVKIQEITKPPAVIRRILPDAPARRVGVVAGSGDHGVTGGPYAELFAAAGARHGVSPALLTAVARAESGFNPRAVSSAGAQGLMQLMPATARGLGVADPFDPAQAVDGAGRLLASHLRRFGSVELALAAYNAGPGAVQRYGGIPPFRETQGYVARIVKELS